MEKEEAEDKVEVGPEKVAEWEVEVNGDEAEKHTSGEEIAKELPERK